MRAYLDTHFPSLDTLAAFLDNEDNTLDRIEERREASHVRAQQAGVEAQRKLAESKTSDFITALEKAQELSENDFSAEEIGQFRKIKDLKAQRTLVSEVIEAEKQLKQPDVHSKELLQALDKFTLIIEEPSSAEDPTIPAITDAVKRIRSEWYDGELSRRSSNLAETLQKSGWPKADPPKKSQTVAGALTSCVEFELSGSRSTLKVIAKPIADRIIFNFEQTKDTARPDKPEWLFSYITKLLDSRLIWINTELRKIVENPVDQLVGELILSISSVCGKTYTIDSHFVFELLEFVKSLESRFLCSSKICDDLLYGILQPKILSDYLESESLEYRGTVARLLKSASQAIDFDADVPCAKPTFLTLNIKQTVEQANYLLRLDSQRVLKDLHLPISQDYLEWLVARIDAFDQTHSSLARAVGNDKEKHKTDVSDLEYLARIFGSASYFKMFLENLSLDALINSSGLDFEELEQKFGELRYESSKRITKDLSQNIQKALKNYFRVDWHNDFTTSTGLMRSAIDTMRPSIHFILKLCPTSRSDQARLLVPVAQSVAKIVWQMVIQANVFPKEAISQLKTDIESIWSGLNLPVVDEYLRVIEACEIMDSSDPNKANRLSKDQIDGLLQRIVK